MKKLTSIIIFGIFNSREGQAGQAKNKIGNRRGWGPQALETTRWESCEEEGGEQGSLNKTRPQGIKKEKDVGGGAINKGQRRRNQN